MTRLAGAPDDGAPGIRPDRSARRPPVDTRLAGVPLDRKHTLLAFLRDSDLQAVALAGLAKDHGLGQTKGHDFKAFGAIAGLRGGVPPRGLFRYVIR